VRALRALVPGDSAGVLGDLREVLDVRYSVSLNYGQALRVDRRRPPEWCPDAKMGRSWWLWLPRLRWNGGSFRRGQLVDITFTWLCFWVGVTFSTVRSVREELALLRQRLDVLEGRAPVGTRAVIAQETARRAFGGES
jgi:hypothetical protein